MIFWSGPKEKLPNLISGLQIYSFSEQVTHFAGIRGMSLQFHLQLETQKLKTCIKTANWVFQEQVDLHKRSEMISDYWQGSQLWICLTVKRWDLCSSGQPMFVFHKLVFQNPRQNALLTRFWMRAYTLYINTHSKQYRVRERGFQLCAKRRFLLLILWAEPRQVVYFQAKMPNILWLQLLELFLFPA